MILQTELYCTKCGLKKKLNNLVVNDDTIKSYLSNDNVFEILCDSCKQALIKISQYSGFVYFLSNPSMPNYLKIGCTRRDIESRVNELNSSTSVPTPFKIEIYFPSTDHYRVEQSIHQALDSYRAPGKEFFNISMKETIKILNSLPDFSNLRSIFENYLYGNRPKISKAERFYQSALSEKVGGFAIQKLMRAVELGHADAKSELERRGYYPRRNGAGKWCY